MVWETPVDLELGQRVRWNLGARVIWAERRTGEWRIGLRETGREDVQYGSLDIGPASDEDGPPRLRCSLGDASERLVLMPRTPDRPLVARTEVSLLVPPGGSTRVHVGIPLCAQIVANDRPLHELPVLELSDTWFGTPLEGILCYATRTHLTMDEALLGPRAHRALCSAEIVNHAPEPLVLDRLRIPAPNLGLWRMEDGQLRTDRLRLVRESGQEDGSVEVLDHGVGKAERISEPRFPVSSGRVVRAFNAVWKNLGGLS